MVINSDMVDQVKERHDTGGRNRRLRNDMIQAPSISPCITRQEEDEDEEIEFTLGRLIRQASLNSSQILPPRHTSKTRSSSSITKYRPKKKLDQPESNNMEVGHQYLSNQANIQRRLSDIQTKEVQGFKSFALKYGEAVSKSIVANIIPNFDPKMLNISSPTMRNWSDKERSAQDMKAQIKFWARAVASNVGAP